MPLLLQMVDTILAKFASRDDFIILMINRHRAAVPILMDCKSKYLHYSQLEIPCRLS